MRTIVDFHAIQTLPPSNINRDMTGAPKTAMFGGVQRARVSTQSWKRAIRDYFVANEDLGTGVRTADVATAVIEAMVTNGDIDPAHMNVQALRGHLLAMLTYKSNTTLPLNKDGMLKTVTMFSGDELLRLGGLALTFDPKATDAAKRAVGARVADIMCSKDHVDVDVALFGRMLAGVAEAKVEAASSHMQILSTHEVEIESDEFTTFDPHAGHDASVFLGTTEHTSATFYRFSTLDLDELASHLGVQGAVDACAAFSRAFVHAVPTGKQNSFYAATTPSLVMVNIRGDRPQPLVNAFETPITGTGYDKTSMQALFDHAFNLQTTFGDKPELSAHTAMATLETNGISERMNLPDLLSFTTAHVSARLTQ